MKPLFVGLLAVILGATACADQSQSEMTLNVATAIPSVSTSHLSPLPVPQVSETPDAVEEGTKGSLSASGQLTRVSGLVLYPELPPYEVWYDANVWQFGGDMEPRLTNRDNPDCYLSLLGPAMENESLDHVRLAGRNWTIRGGGWDENGELGNSIIYVSLEGVGAYIFEVDLPEPYQAGEKSICQQLAEDVIDTFKIMD